MSQAPPAGVPLKVAIAGSSGRMGRMLIEAVCATPDMTLAGALDMPSSPAVGTDPVAFLGRTSELRVTGDIAAGLAGADVLIDFTRPEATLAHLAACRSAGIRMVIGTTGLGDAERAAVREAARDIAVVQSPNMSAGVNVAMKLVAMAARALAADCDVEVIESHHRDKVDAPSGTALKLGEIVAQAQGRPLAELAVFAREGHTGPRTAGSIGFATIRAADIVGEHTVLFASAGERIEITHRSTSRVNYAQGSLRAARFVASQQRGFFDMEDVLGLR
ncbi:MAG: 4-hydroxy-tetrahydrodipicolinate reductase [Burkholderiaceae bacterium]|nr:4-hydroxy-tetrahydrodipicolinate reductase [Burkholderiaceae bacterium]